MHTEGDGGRGYTIDPLARLKNLLIKMQALVYFKGPVFIGGF